MRRRLFALGLAFVGCGPDEVDCEPLIQEARELKKEFAACSEGDECVLLAQSNDDCTGELTCPYAVNSKVVDEARRRAQQVTDESVSCTVCTNNSCAQVPEPVCDVALGRCVIP
jgi:hypothetical protein